MQVVVGVCVSVCVFMLSIGLHRFIVRLYVHVCVRTNKGIQLNT